MKQRTGIFGGTFDPIHLGHLIAASEFQFQLQLQEVWFTPAALPPHKLQGNPASAADRCRMIELAIAHQSGFFLCVDDLDDRRPSYTVDLLRHLSTDHPDREFVFLMGEDSLRDLHTWKSPAEIAELAELGVAIRPGVKTGPLTVAAELEIDPNRIHLVDMPEIGISSTEIRERVRQREPIRFLVPELVESYISGNRLYHG